MFNTWNCSVGDIGLFIVFPLGLAIFEQISVELVFIREKLQGVGLGVIFPFPLFIACRALDALAVFDEIRGGVFDSECFGAVGIRANEVVRLRCVGHGFRVLLLV